MQAYLYSVPILKFFKQDAVASVFSSDCLGLTIILGCITPNLEISCYIIAMFFKKNWQS